MNHGPESLPHWCVSTRDPKVAKAVAQRLGGRPAVPAPDAEDRLEILTHAAKVKVVAGPGALVTDMRLWSHSRLVHHCDGARFLGPEGDRDRPCGCPRFMTERKAAAKSFQGPQPNTVLTFRLADAPELGLFRFHSMSWKLAEAIQEAKDAIDCANDGVLVELGLELVKLPTASGVSVSYRKPVIKVLKAVG
ncbi:hypothetical protein GCM10010219_66720 [Streptomyces netropsis]|nr:hypothetical protein GCM10010219_66720 [Streptomyces netropsis]